MPSKDYTYKTFGDSEPLVATVHYDDLDKMTSKAIAIASHGGGWTVGNKDMIPRPQIDWLIKNGFVVVAYNYRLCPHVSMLEGPFADTSSVYHWCRTTLPGLLKQDVGLKVDGDRIVAFGHSAGGTNSLYLGRESPPPKAILSFYGALLFYDPSWTRPISDEAFPIPSTFDAAVMDRLFSEPVATASDPSDYDFSKPRPAWFCDKLKNGRLIATLTGEDFDRFDPMRMGKLDAFPPTFLAHWEGDKFVDAGLQRRACEELRAKGLEAEISIVPGGGHGADTGVEEGHQWWEPGVLRGLEFLKRHVNT